MSVTPFRPNKPAPYKSDPYNGTVYVTAAGFEYIDGVEVEQPGFIVLHFSRNGDSVGTYGPYSSMLDAEATALRIAHERNAVLSPPAECCTGGVQ
jgi:hypothetical protein